MGEVLEAIATLRSSSGGHGAVHEARERIPLDRGEKTQERKREERSECHVRGEERQLM